MNPLKIFGIRKRIVLNHSSDYSTIIEAITDEQYKKLKEEKQAKGQCSFKVDNVFIPPSDVIVYGDLNLTKRGDREILNKMENKIWDKYNNHWYYTRMDYNTGIVHPNESRKSYLMSQTFDLIKWVKYLLVWLGNPTNIIIYKLSTKYIKENSPKILLR